MIKTVTKIGCLILVFFLMVPAFAQDNRRLETKVADVLAQFPAQNGAHTSKLMVQMLETGADGMAQFCDRVVAPGTGDDTQARMALESLAQFAGGPNQDKNRPVVEAALLTALEKATDTEVKAFFIRRLPYCGSFESVVQLGKYLDSAELYEPVLATLTSIGQPEAGALILKNLPGKTDQPLIAMVKTLGQLIYQPAEPALIELAKSSKGAVLLQVYSALANIGGKSSYPVFETAAKRAKFQPDDAQLMTSYLKYANRLAEQGDIKSSNRLCASVLKNCTEDNQLVYRSAALAVPGFGNNKLFLKEIKNNSKVYRNAVLNNASVQLNSENVGAWIGALKKAPAETKAEILYFLAKRTEPEVVVNAILPSLDSKEESVRLEAIRALALNQKAKAVPALIDQLKKVNTTREIAEIQQALKITTSEKESDLIIAQLEAMNDAGKVVMINILGARRATGAYPLIKKQCSSANPEVSAAAFSALETVVKAENGTDLIAMLRVTDDKKSLTHIQNALIGIYSGSEKVDPTLVLYEIQKGDMNEKLIPILSSLSDPKALKIVVGLLESGHQAELEAAFVSLSNWNDVKAIPHLLEAFANPDMKKFRAEALKAYIRITNQSDLPDDQKLLMIEKLMSHCSSTAEKTQVIRAAGNVKTFLSFVFVSTYLNEPELSGAAAYVAKTLALPSSEKKNGLTGEFVADVLTNVMGKMTGPDSQYDVIDLREYLEKMPKVKGFVRIFNEKDLTGWQGLVKDPIARGKMKKEELNKAQLEANSTIGNNWSVKDGSIVFNGKGDNLEGDNLCTQKMYGDFEMLVDWRISKGGDSGIYLRGAPQVQIWDPYRVGAKALVGSGGLFNNQKNPAKPLVLADNAIGDWNTFRIKMVGDKVTVYLNGVLVVDNVVMENYWDRSMPIFKTEAIELQAHGTDLAFRNIFVKELNVDDVRLAKEEESDGFKLLFNGQNLDNWTGNKLDYTAEDGMLVVSSTEGAHGNLFTEKEYADFIFRFEFQLTPGANNGLAIHAPLDGDAAYAGKELQILDNSASIYKDLKPYQYHGSVYGILAAKRGFLKPVGEWNYQEVIVRGENVKVTLNGTVILEGNMTEAGKNGLVDHQDHPGLQRHKGHIGFLGHGSDLKFRNIRIKEL